MATTVEDMARKLGQRVEYLRRERGWSRERLGPGLTGLSAATIQRIERGRKRDGQIEWVMPDGDTLVALANAFDTDLPGLFAERDTPGYRSHAPRPPHAVARTAA